MRVYRTSCITMHCTVPYKVLCWFLSVFITHNSETLIRQGKVRQSKPRHVKAGLPLHVCITIYATIQNVKHILLQVRTGPLIVVRGLMPEMPLAHNTIIKEATGAQAPKLPHRALQLPFIGGPPKTGMPCLSQVIQRDLKIPCALICAMCSSDLRRQRQVHGSRHMPCLSHCFLTA